MVKDISVVCPTALGVYTMLRCERKKKSGVPKHTVNSQCCRFELAEEDTSRLSLGYVTRSRHRGRSTGILLRQLKLAILTAQRKSRVFVKLSELTLL